MLKKDNRQKVLSIFFDNPLAHGTGFQLRELGRLAGLSPLSVGNYLQALEKEGLVLSQKHRLYGYPIYFANRENDYFKLLKKQGMVLSIMESGLLRFLKDSCMPDAIILFGSASRGEDIKESDIDIFLLCPERKIDLRKYESKLGRAINPMFCENLKVLSGEIKNNVANGIILHGFLKLF